MGPHFVGGGGVCSAYTSCYWDNNPGVLIIGEGVLQIAAIGSYSIGTR